ncbi:hypothetical protein [Natrinema versiforme]|uniref:Uncharacterized protein n=1 Tax=Natrinema versiforme JCM 10478 TaxID=1227496 RepID=L9XNM1_9EURY|nr:hypothetical protein [Natrinema versiforme]ELY63152.1 hypothetical protein C489_20101 [Natrinema versiforme JCM 10478]
MNEVVRSRLLVLVGLAVIGVGLAGVGTALGVAEPLATTGTSAEFVVAEDNVTFATGDESETVVDDLSNVSEITIEETDTGEFTVQTTEERPLTDSERERARTIAMTNETVKTELGEMDTYELSVEPIRKLSVDAFSQESYDVAGGLNETNNGTVIIGTTDDGGDGSITVERDPSYVQDRANVRIRQPNASDRHELQYTVDIDVANGTVTDITDWDDIRQESPTVTMTGELNSSETVDIEN